MHRKTSLCLDDDEWHAETAVTSTVTPKATFAKASVSRASIAFSF